MSSEEELSPELKSFEAELASLSARTDRLDRDRLMFLAGQASAAQKPAAGRLFGSAWAWPVALGAMTTVAATLLVALLVQPQPEIVERLIEVPSERPNRAVAGIDDRRAGASDRSERQPSPSPQEFTVPAPPPGRLVSVYDGPRGQADWTLLPAKAPYAQLRDQVLARGLDWWTPSPIRSSDPERAAAPATYRNVLESLLGQPGAGKSPDRPAKGVFFSTGVNS
jgi:hypothetical protein